MNWFESIVAFIVIWWLLFFMVLPWGVHVPDKVEQGHATSAPAKPKLWQKMAITTGIAIVLWGVVFWIASTDLISFRNG